MESSRSRTARLIRLGRIPYPEARRLQEAIYRSLRAGEAGDGALLLLEHPDTITIGRQPDSERHLLAPREELCRLGIDLIRADRGGDVTYHGPGQLVAYSILPLRFYRKDVGWYLRQLETVGIETCRALGIRAARAEGMTGVWTDRGKVMAIGVGVGGWVTYHGAALNCETDLSRYDLIVPCGLADTRVTSLSELARRSVSVDEAAGHFAAAFARAFGIDRLVEVPAPAPAPEGVPAC